MAVIKKVGITKIRDLKENESPYCHKCGENKITTGQFPTRTMMNGETEELMCCLYWDAPVCECGCEEFGIVNEVTGDEVQGDVFIHTELTDN